MKSVKNYKHLFFDLDHTLWDFESNSHETLKELFYEYGLDKRILSFENFIRTYHAVNKTLWEYYHKNEVDKETLRYARFALTLHDFEIDDLHLAKRFGDDYIRISPHKGKLFPGAIEVLKYLSRNYQMHLITNGFKEVQHIKIKTSGLEPFFDNLIISEDVGYMKPDKAIFNYALKKAGTKADFALMIGDNIEADIIGAANAGIDTVFFNPEKIPVNVICNFTISQLDELKEIL